MPTRRESIMETVLPRIEEYLRRMRDQGRWGALPAALGTRGPTGASEPWEHVRKADTLTVEDLDALERGESVESRSPVRDLAWEVLAEANKTLFTRLDHCLEKQTQSAPPRTLRARVAQAKETLNVDAVDVLVARGTWRRILDDGSATQRLIAVLGGGSLVPVVGLDPPAVYAIPHQSGRVVVEVEKELSAQWDFADRGGVEIVARERFRLVVFAPVPAVQIDAPS